MIVLIESKHNQPSFGSNTNKLSQRKPKSKDIPKKSPIPTKKLILTEHDQILEAFHNKFKEDDGKQYILKDEDLPEVITAVNGKGLENWTKVAWAVQDTIVKLNLKKRGIKIPE